MEGLMGTQNPESKAKERINAVVGFSGHLWAKIHHYLLTMWGKTTAVGATTSTFSFELHDCYLQNSFNQ